MRTPFVVGNWKLHKTIAEGLALVTELKNALAVVKGVHVGVAPTFVSINPIAKRLDDSTILTCAQDCHWETFGPWTGEVSPPLLADAGVSWIIVGHSERRQFLGDTNEVVGKKVPAVLAANLVLHRLGVGLLACELALGPHDHRARDLALLHLRARNRFADRHDDDVADARVAPARTAEHLDAVHLLRAAVVGNVEDRSHLDHDCAPSTAFVIVRSRRQRLVRDIGRDSMISTRSPTLPELFSSCT